MRLAERCAPAVAAAAGLGAVLLVAVAVPSIDSAFSSSVHGDAGAAAKARFTCADVFAGEPRHRRAYFEYALDEGAGAEEAVDSSAAGNDGRYEGSRGQDGASPIACPGDDGAAYRLDGSTSRVTTSIQDGPIVSGFSEEVRFEASSPGKLLGYEIDRTGDSSNYDKHLYIDTAGRLVYGTDGNGVQTIRTSSSVVDGTWHQAVATTSPTDGSVLYLDGAAVASDPSMTAGETFSGYWRIGQGKLLGWPDHPDSTWFTGSLRFAAAYPYVLTAQEVAAEASIGAPGAAASTSTRTATPAATAASAPDEPDGSATAAATPAVSTGATDASTPSAHPDPTASTGAATDADASDAGAVDASEDDAADDGPGGAR